MDKIRTLKAKRGEIVKFMNVLFLIPQGLRMNLFVN